jgi:hypothetical protein
MAAVAALILAAMVGWLAFNFGVEQGTERAIARSGKIVVAPVAPVAPGAPGAAYAPYPYPYPYSYYGWHRPIGIFTPLIFLFVTFAIIRGMFFRRHWRYGYGSPYGGGCGNVDDWHRQMHERMEQQKGRGTSTP